MASSGKQKTTTAKRLREARLRERRIEKQVKKDARKLAASDRADALTHSGDSPTPRQSDGSLDPAEA
jgi:hypothetical protein